MESKELETPKRTRRTSVVQDPKSNPPEVEVKISALKTPRRTRRTSILESESLDKEEHVVALKTPKRTRRTSVLDQPALAELPEQEESDGSSLPKIDPVTPGRSTLALDSRTPSRCDVLSQTPRRSCRKSIKPVQEYENIVAQKGLSAKAKRLIIESTASDDVVDEVAPTIIVEEREAKWTAADIGRVSSKRSKKKSKKNKRLQRQNKVDENEEGNEEAKHFEGQQSSSKSHDCEDGDAEMVAEEKDDKKLEDEKEVVADINVEEPEPTESKAEQRTVEVEENGVETSLLKAPPTPIEHRNDEEFVSPDDQQVEKEISSSDITQTTKEISPPVLGIEDDHKSVESNDSMDEGDIILNALPVTGDDDVMQSPEKSRQSNPKMSLLVTPMTEPANKSDDSDCIMLSLSESSQSRLSISQRPPSTVGGEIKCDANESSDSLAVNMPPLVVCSDDEEEDDNAEFVDALESPVRSEEISKEPDSTSNADGEPLDRTFETAEKKDDTQPSSAKKAEQLISPDEDDDEEEGGKVIEILMSPEEIKKIVFGGIEEKTTDNVSKPSPAEDEDVQMTPLDVTFEAADRPPIEINDFEATPKSLDSRPSITRLPTPFKADKVVMPDVYVEAEDDDLEETFEMIVVPVENPLKSSRKRSFSFSGADRPKKNVTFHSPSNVTMNIYDGDLMKNATKHTPTNITKRRKRSLSVTETDRDLMDYIQRKKPTQGTTPQKKTVHQSRIKMPNFSNIHQKQFQRMESISDHVARRAERAKNLINSSTKIKPASAQKCPSVKNSILQDHNKDGTKTHLPKPKARQRIDMSGPENKSIIDQTTNPNPLSLFKTRAKATKQDKLLSNDFAPLASKTPTKLNANINKQKDGNKLLKPRFNFNFNATTESSSCGNATISAAVPQRMHLPNPREFFNLSTNIHSSTTTGSHLAALKADKVEDRRKRMMEMFKSKTTQRVGENKKEILKGVRTNRRFELQMMCRNRQNLN